MWFYVLIIIILLVLLMNKETPLDKSVNTLTRQAARWSTAAVQDENPMIAVLHANYGAGYLWAINDIVTSSEFENMTGHDYKKFRDSIVNVQDTATKRALQICPEFGPKRNYLTTVGGE